ncbi:MAG TPA: hypothetical protein VIX14_01615, partial [Terriglobales bacterium]
HPKNNPFQTVSAILEASQLAPLPFAAHNWRQISGVPDGQMGLCGIAAGQGRPLDSGKSRR